MIVPAFVIFSARRTGSTALYRALNLIPGAWVVYQPQFDEIEPTEDAVHERMTGLLSDYSGLKHVFEPSGFPFRPPDWAGIDEMERNWPFWARLNSAILNYPGIRVVFLRRRNGFMRILSDQVSKLTKIFGTGEHPASATDAAIYRRDMCATPIPAVDSVLTRWYMENLPRLEDGLRASIAANPVMDVWYEDLLGDDVTLSERLARFRDVAQFLDLDLPAAVLRAPELSLILRPAAKLNSEKIYRRIPNYSALAAEFETPADPRFTMAVNVAAGSTRLPLEGGQGADDYGLIDAKKWRLRSARNTRAGLKCLPGQTGAVRVFIEQINALCRHDIQLSLPDQMVKGGERYVLRFYARADRPRRICAGVAQAHPPWQDLGYYEAVDLNVSWKTFQREFVASTSDDCAHIIFDVGEDNAGVELDRVILTSSAPVAAQSGRPSGSRV